MISNNLESFLACLINSHTVSGGGMDWRILLILYGVDIDLF